MPAGAGGGRKTTCRACEDPATHLRWRICRPSTCRSARSEVHWFGGAQRNVRSRLPHQLSHSHSRTCTCNYYALVSGPQRFSRAGVADAMPATTAGSDASHRGPSILCSHNALTASRSPLPWAAWAYGGDLCDTQHRLASRACAEGRANGTRPGPAMRARLRTIARRCRSFRGSVNSRQVFLDVDARRGAG